ncbi:MAG: helix-turn-helix domain-containing protein [Halobacteriales archaeon]
MTEQETADTDDEEQTTEQEADSRIQEVEEEVTQQVEELEQEVEGRIEEVEERVEEVTEEARENIEEARDNLEETFEDTLDTVNDNLVDVGSQILDTRARTDVYVALRALEGGDVDEVAEESGLYPGKVEEVLEELVEDEIVTEDDGEYTAVGPTELVRVLPRRITDRISDLLPEANGAADGEDGRRVLSSRFSPYRLVIEPNDDEDATEIPIEGNVA